MKSIFDKKYRQLIGWLVAERKYKKVTQAALAERLGYTNQSYLSKIESFERRLDILEFVRLCEALEVDPHEGIDLLLK